MDLKNIELFPGEDHQPFRWEGGQPAALLVHGFPGTPKEMRPLARVLHEAGWTTQGILLPGLGNDIDTLFERRYHDWISAISSSLATLQANHHPVLLLGYSLGGALSILTANERSPDAMILLAPFWRAGNRLSRLIWLAMTPFFMSFQPLKKASFEEPRIRHYIKAILPDADLDSPEVQKVLREFRVPRSLLNQLLTAGREAGRIANQLSLPILIVQGTEDRAVRAEVTRKLIQQFPGPVRYEEMVAGHDLVKAESPGWTQVSRSVLRFADELNGKDPS